MANLYPKKTYYFVMNNKHKEGLFRVSIFIFAVMVYILLDIECLFIKFFNKPCLGCGMTRAWISILEGDIRQAYQYHKAYWTVPFIILYIFKGNFLFRKRLWDIMLLSLIMITFIFNYTF